MRIILIRYGELTLKGGNRKEFERVLYNHITKQLNEYNVTSHKDRNRIYVNILDESQYDEIKSKLQKVPGISSFSVAHEAELDMDSIKKVAIENYDTSKKTFKVETKRSNKNFELLSQEISRDVGAALLKAYDGHISVDIHNYESLVKVEIQKGKAYVFTDIVKGMGGFPLGTSGKGIVLLSGGIDSPVSAVEAMKKGLKINCVHFSTPPYTSKESFKKVKDILSVLHEYDKDIKLFDVNVTPLQTEMVKHTENKYSITLLRRMMFRKSTQIAKKLKSNVLITGESLGQVASQTIESMTATHDATDMLVVQPLIALDKTEIIKKAREYNTYDISIRPFEDCCVIFVPDKPVIKPVLEKVIEQEEKISFQTFLDECEINMYNYDIINNDSKKIDKFL